MERRSLFWGLLGWVVAANLPARAQDGESRMANRDVGQKVQLAGLKVSVWEPPQSSQHGPLPLIVFSHGFHGSSEQSTSLCHALAQAGYLVMAPNHKDAGMTGGLRPEAPFKDADKWTEATFQDRCQDVTGLLAALHKDAHWGKSIDWSRVGLAGHSLGGYTVLGLAGAWPSWKLKGVKVKAILALSPYTTPFIDHGNLQDISAPVMYQGGTADFGITPFVKKENGAYAKTASPAYFVEFEKAGHFAWTDLNPRFQKDINDYSLAFFARYLKGDKEVDLSTKRGQVSQLLWK